GPLCGEHHARQPELVRSEGEERGETGAMTKGTQAREHVFVAELAGETAKARLAARLAKEELTRLMGLWGTDLDYQV
ncbi:hypothetical protein ACC718_39560, partial [Rhizobium ruizarguesonis]